LTCIQKTADDRPDEQRRAKGASVSAALAELMETIGRACIRYADEIRGADVRAAELHVQPAADPVEELGLGSRQRQIVDILRSAGEAGLTTAQIADGMGGHDTANAHMSLRALHGRRVVDEVPGLKPIHWRLAPQFRATADPYLDAAERVRSGEWTTEGDISIAVRGDTRGVPAVGRAASTLDEFPNAHRVLHPGGVLPDERRSTDAHAVLDPEDCRQLLENEGVTFDADGRARHEHYVPWHVLVERSTRELAA
jgi:hypothetical protein